MTNKVASPSRSDYNGRSLQQRVFACAVEANVPVYLVGPPGVGKTEFVSSYAKLNGYEAVVLSAPHIEPGDITGLPVEAPTGDGRFRTQFAVMDWLEQLNQSEKGLLFIDELTLAGDDTRKALLSLIQGRTAGTHKLADHVRIVAAGNPMKWSFESVPLSAPMRTRLLHIQWMSDTDEWLEHHRTGYRFWTPPALPDGDRMGEDICRLLDGALQTQPGVINRESIMELDPEAPFNVNRSWDNVFSILRCVPTGDFEVVQAVLDGLVGQEARANVMASLRYRLPVNETLEDPYSFDWRNESPDRAYALLATFADSAVDDSAKRIGVRDAEKVFIAAAKSGRADMAFAQLSIVAKRLKSYEFSQEIGRVFQDFLI